MILAFIFITIIIPIIIDRSGNRFLRNFKKSSLSLF